MKTFVVRLFVAAGPEVPSGAFHGVVEEVSGGRRATFGDGEELLALLAQSAATADEERLEQSVA